MRSRNLLARTMRYASSLKHRTNPLDQTSTNVIRGVVFDVSFSSLFIL